MINIKTQFTPLRIVIAVLLAIAGTSGKLFSLTEFPVFAQQLLWSLTLVVPLAFIHITVNGEKTDAMPLVVIVISAVLFIHHQSINIHEQILKQPTKLILEKMPCSFDESCHKDATREKRSA